MSAGSWRSKRAHRDIELGAQAQPTTLKSRRVGICPEDKKIILVKSLAHFRADYAPIAKEIIEVDLPGVAAINPAIIPYQNVTRPIYPLDRF
jgi:microcystin degradation protein MlrC